MAGAEDFLALHHGPGFVLPNAWDAGSARILEQAGFPALATTSAGIAWAAGRPDAGVDGDTMLGHVERIVAAVGVPVSADLESGYADNAEGVARTVARAVDVGVVGVNLEDQVAGRLLDVDAAADRIAAARTVAPPGQLVINARTDTYFGAGSGDLFEQTVHRARRYVEAGADCVFVPGVTGEETIRRLADAVPAPLNVVAGLAGDLLDARTLFGLGVRRISVGGSLTRAVLTFVERAGREMIDAGTFSFCEGAMPYADVQRRFEP